MIEKVTGGKPLPAEVQQQIVSKTDGVPLFVEELTKMVLESGIVERAGRLLYAHWTAASTRDSYHLARLTHGAARSVSDSKEVAQMGATLGREFSYELLHAVSPVDEATSATGADQASGSGSALPAGAAAAGTLHLQACLDSGYGLSIATQEQTTAVSPTDCPGLEERFPRRKRPNPNCWPITTPRQASCAGHSLLAAGRTKSHRALG